MKPVWLFVPEQPKICGSLSFSSGYATGFYSSIHFILNAVYFNSDNKILLLDPELSPHNQHFAQCVVSVIQRSNWCRWQFCTSNCLHWKLWLCAHEAPYTAHDLCQSFTGQQCSTSHQQPHECLLWHNSNALLWAWHSQLANCGSETRGMPSWRKKHASHSPLTTVTIVDASPL